MRYTYNLIIIFSLICILSGCSKSGPNFPPNADHSVDFTHEVKPIFHKRCLSCHGPLKQKGQLRLDDKNSALRKEILIPGQSHDSAIIQHLLGMNEKKRMPPQPPFLGDNEIGIIQAWIDQGALWPDSEKLEPPQPINDQLHKK